MLAYPTIHSAEQHRQRGLVRRIALGALPLIVALGFAFGPTATGPQEAQARPVGVLSSGCYYNGQYYAHGQVVEMSGVAYLCQNGRWVLSPFFSPREVQVQSVFGR